MPIGIPNRLNSLLFEVLVSAQSAEDCPILLLPQKKGPKKRGKAMLNFEWSMLNGIHVGFCVQPVPIVLYSSDFGLKSSCIHFGKPTRHLL
jgi:hypothetical protein